jgi:hypothetical protein
MPHHFPVVVVCFCFCVGELVRLFQEQQTIGKNRSVQRRVDGRKPNSLHVVDSYCDVILVFVSAVFLFRCGERNENTTSITTAGHQLVNDL